MYDLINRIKRSLKNLWFFLDSQDLDDKVIHHLSEENRRLKEELELVREGHEIGVAEGIKSPLWIVHK